MICLTIGGIEEVSFITDVRTAIIYEDTHCERDHNDNDEA